MTEISKAFDHMSASTSQDNTAVYRINETHSVIVADGYFTISNKDGEILECISVNSFAQNPRSGFRKIKNSIS